MVIFSKKTFYRVLTSDFGTSTPYPETSPQNIYTALTTTGMVTSSASMSSSTLSISESITEIVKPGTTISTKYNKLVKNSAVVKTSFIKVGNERLYLYSAFSISLEQYNVYESTSSKSRMFKGDIFYLTMFIL